MGGVGGWGRVGVVVSVGQSIGQSVGSSSCNNDLHTFCY